MEAASRYARPIVERAGGRWWRRCLSTEAQVSGRVNMCPRVLSERRCCGTRGSSRGICGRRLRRRGDTATFINRVYTALIVSSLKNNLNVHGIWVVSPPGIDNTGSCTTSALCVYTLWDFETLTSASELEILYIFKRDFLFFFSETLSSSTERRRPRRWCGSALYLSPLCIARVPNRRVECLWIPTSSSREGSKRETAIESEPLPDWSSVRRTLHHQRGRGILERERESDANDILAQSPSLFFINHVSIEFFLFFFLFRFRRYSVMCSMGERRNKKKGLFLLFFNVSQEPGVKWVRGPARCYADGLFLLPAPATGMNMDGPAVVGARAYRLADRRQGEREKRKKMQLG